MPVEQVFTTANEKLCEGNEAGMFVTAWMGLLNVKTGLVTFANAGHNPPLVRQGEGGFAYHKTRAGFVLAGMEGIRYRRFEMQLTPGDTICLYTDGVTEATNAAEKLYGEERLLALMNQQRGASANGICEAIKADVDAFVGEAEQFDDITMLCLTWHGPQAAEVST
jgi:serine phosphatase RsbU (regulator of sigma subunit)